jgi:hypothetical protein
MRLLIPVLTFPLFAGCIPQPTEVKTPDDTGDTGVEDTGDLPSCGEENLVFGALVEDAAGPCEACPHGLTLSFYGTVTNPCEGEVTLYTSAEWIVDGYSLEPLGLESSEPDRDESHPWVMQPGEVMREELLAMTLPQGSYLLEVQFTDLPTPHAVAAVFDVVTQ